MQNTINGWCRFVYMLADHGLGNANIIETGCRRRYYISRFTSTKAKPQRTGSIMSFRFLIAKSIVCLLMLTTVSMAQSNFTGNGDGSTWNDAANWDNGVPLGINANIGDTFTVNLASNQFVNETDIVGDQSTGTAILNHTTGSLDNAGWIKIGHNADNDGTYMGSGDAVINYAVLFAASNGGNATIDLSGDAVLNGSGGFSVGLNPSAMTDAVINVADNATINATDFNLGQATLTQSGGQVTASAWLAIGKDGGSGTYNISGGSVTLTADWFTVGENQPGALNISGDASVEATLALGMIVGRDDNGAGTLEVTGSSASINVADLRAGVDARGLDSTATAIMSWIADAGGISTVVSNDNSEFGAADTTLMVDLTAYAGSDDEFLLIDNAMPVSGTFDGLAEGSSIDVGSGNMATISYIGGIDGNDIVLTMSKAFLLGDVNCDGFVDLLDVAPFVDLLTEGIFEPKADINQDGFVDLLDVAPFVDLLSGG